MKFTTAVKTCIVDKYCTFHGRASRSEYWYFNLFLFIISIPLGIIGDLSSEETALILNIIGALIFFLPSLGVSIRRMHDINKSGWIFLVALIPLIGLIVWIYLTCKKGTEGSNRFGEPTV